ncbi:MAG: DNA-binding protein [Parcubacteria group bacterium CG1_02_37_51]|uniref:DNA-binding protein n=2 Tax=Candidatus Komeiliibacteriota TaxID=1817908 RepID=A0A2M8DPU0_9BACT|nr:MAG: DNA-binding protein [Parcubacteria group bacterium CG1_02_37_51]PIY95259.1 MAG: DNA-binding protein [Candidatus Komeilibacteria bacterium CG_4_10_14_0_8_um_filter_37_78]PJC00936.1 MAG: DNA-binding protein [Candidatus Komeilibacteria bacterium CG_4_9_14_0_8_um_filter_36_9]
MKKAQLIEKIANKAGLGKKDVERVLDAFESVTIDALLEKDEVTLTGFGTFSARFRSSRLGVDPRNPQQKIQMPEMSVPKFKAGKNLKEALKK